MTIKSLVKIKQEKGPYCNPDFYDLHGAPAPDRIYFGYGEMDFFHICGAIGWPSGFGSKPGCALVIGVTREDVPRFEVLDAVFCSSPREILRNCLLLRDKFGFRECSKLFNYWIADSSRFGSIENEFNNELDNQIVHHGVFTNDPVDFDKPNADEIYVDQLRNISSERRLILSNQFHDIREALQSMSPSDMKLNDFPAAAALGYAAHELETVKPWIHNIRSFTIEDDGGHE